MIYEQDVRNMLSRCSGYDPSHFPQPSQVIVAAWLEHFSQFPRLASEDVHNAVRKYYNVGDRKVPQPADISSIARDLWRDRYEREDLEGELHREIEALSEAKAEPEPPMIESHEPPVEAKREAYQAMLESFAARRGVAHVLREPPPPSFTEDARAAALAALEARYPETAAERPVDGPESESGTGTGVEA